MELDIGASTKKDGRQEANIITKNLVPGESAVAKSAREQDFPIFLLNRGLEVRLERGGSCVLNRLLLFSFLISVIARS